jgi:hypothetical protein
MTKRNWMSGFAKIELQLPHYCQHITNARLKAISVLSVCVLVAIGLNSGVESLVVFGAEYSHTSTSAVNDCGNGYLATEIYCTNHQSAIIGDNNKVAISSGITPQDGASTNVERTSSNDDQNSPDNGNQLPVDLSVVADPTLVVFPCCDDMPGNG